jgi:hypothetical protein
MCDYSLELVASRPAKVGDKLISTGFPNSVSRGFASLDDLNVAVCLAPGTELAFEEEVKCDAGSVFSRHLSHKVASFRQIDTSKHNRYHDALEFPDGQIVLLTCLCRGQRATVLQLPKTASVSDGLVEHGSSLVA